MSSMVISMIRFKDDFNDGFNDDQEGNNEEHKHRIQEPQGLMDPP